MQQLSDVINYSGFSPPHPSFRDLTHVGYWLSFLDWLPQALRGSCLLGIMCRWQYPKAAKKTSLSRVLVSERINLFQKLRNRLSIVFWQPELNHVLALCQLHNPTVTVLEKSRFTTWARKGPVHHMATWRMVNKMVALLAKRKGVDDCWVGNQVSNMGNCLRGLYGPNEMMY